MTQWLTLSRAARLIGVSRGALQRQVREGLLPSNEGLVSIEGLLRLYPEFSVENSGAFERVARIRNEAFGRRVQERVLPSQEVLAQRLYAQSRELADAQRHLSRYHELVVDLQARLDAVAAASPGADLEALRAAFARGLAEVLATESADALAIMDDMLKVVSAQVKVRPSGHEFFVDGRDTLLQAGLKAGLNLSYGCGNGTCGLCKARVVSGAVTKVAPFDYRLSELERQQGYTLLCAHSAGSGEIVIETLEAGGPGEIPEQEIEVRVRQVQVLAGDTLLVHVQTPRSNRLRFLAGQNVTLYRSVDGVEVHGAYPIASCPCDDRNLQFHVARDERDALAEMFFAGAARAGDTLRLWGPTGDFVLAESGRPLSFIACDTGFAPVKSLIEHAMAGEEVESISLDWLATRPDRHYLSNQCRAWAAAFDGFRYAAHADRDPVQGARRLIETLATELPLAGRDVYVAGPGVFVEAAATALGNAGVPDAQLRVAVI